MTAMVLLTVKSMQSPRHEDLSLDDHLLESSLKRVRHMVDETKSEALQSFHATFTELRQHTHRKLTEVAVS
jgi:tRNA A-37 threonylcarbamoyl transferase component Bud32